jgi:hypothetical protein
VNWTNGCRAHNIGGFHPARTLILIPRKMTAITDRTPTAILSDGNQEPSYMLSSVSEHHYQSCGHDAKATPRMSNEHQTQVASGLPSLELFNSITIKSSASSVVLGEVAMHSASQSYYMNKDFQTPEETSTTAIQYEIRTTSAVTNPLVYPVSDVSNIFEESVSPTSSAPSTAISSLCRTDSSSASQTETATSIGSSNSADEPSHLSSVDLNMMLAVSPEHVSESNLSPPILLPSLDTHFPQAKPSTLTSTFLTSPMPTVIDADTGPRGTGSSEQGSNNRQEEGDGGGSREGIEADWSTSHRHGPTFEDLRRTANLFGQLRQARDEAERAGQPIEDEDEVAQVILSHQSASQWWGNNTESDLVLEE